LDCKVSHHADSSSTTLGLGLSVGRRPGLQDGGGVPSRTRSSSDEEDR